MCGQLDPTPNNTLGEGVLLASTMKIIFLFLYCNPSSASGVSTGNICMNMCHPPGHLQNLCFGSYVTWLQVAFSIPHQLAGDLLGKRRGNREQSKVVYLWNKLL